MSSDSYLFDKAKIAFWTIGCPFRRPLPLREDLFQLYWPGMRVFSFLTDFRFFRSPRIIFVIVNLQQNAPNVSFFSTIFLGVPPAKCFQFLFITMHSHAWLTFASAVWWDLQNVGVLGHCSTILTDFSHGHHSSQLRWMIRTNKAYFVLQVSTPLWITRFKTSLVFYKSMINDIIFQTDNKG